MTKVQIASGILVQENKLLLCLRQNTRIYSGYWAFPGGRVKPGESPSSTIKRELREEIGIEATSLTEPFVLYEFQGNHEHHISIIKEWKGTPQNLEPELCSSIQWYPIDSLPEPLIPVCKRALIENFQERHIRPAKVEEAQKLTQLNLRSKAFWGYDESFIQKYTWELTITPKFIEEHPTFVMISDDKIIGYYMFMKRSEERVELEYLFVEPDWIGKGIGRILIEHAKTYALSNAFREIVILADPHAKPFYLSKGAIQIGEKESLSIPGKMVPQLIIPLHLNSIFDTI